MIYSEFLSIKFMSCYTFPSSFKKIAMEGFTQTCLQTDKQTNHTETITSMLKVMWLHDHNKSAHDPGVAG